MFLVANLVTTSKALVTTSDAPVPSSFLLLLVRHLLLLVAKGLSQKIEMTVLSFPSLRHTEPHPFNDTSAQDGRSASLTAPNGPAQEQGTRHEGTEGIKKEPMCLPKSNSLRRSDGLPRKENKIALV